MGLFRRVFDKRKQNAGIIAPQEETRAEDVADILSTIPAKHPEHLSLINTPLADGVQDHDDQGSDHSDTHSHSEKRRDSDATLHSSHKEFPRAPDEPVLKVAHEAPTIELFFDLYFVANLTVFSQQHEIHSWNALRSYVGFFTIIWFTWFQHTLYDVRFSNDSVLERVCKALQFGVMTGLAMSGPGYVTGFEPDSDDAALAVKTYRTLALILMGSRFLLAAQYGSALYMLRHWKKAVAPLVAHILILATAAFVYLGLFFLVDEFKTETVLIGWYLMSVIESLLILGISGQVSFLSLRKTYLVERLGLLTLIILGEGIMVTCFTLYSIGSVNTFNAGSIAQIICCVLIVYFIWMLYFDAVQPERMGKFRHHLWAILHFPFHASVVFMVEGMGALAIWNKVLNLTAPLSQAVKQVSVDKPTYDSVVQLNSTMTDVINKFWTLSSVETVASFVTLPDQTENFEALLVDNVTSDSAKKHLRAIYNAGIAFVCGKFKIQAHHEHETDHEDNGEEELSAESDEAIFALFETVYVYFFIFAGMVLILLSILFLLGKRKKLPGEIVTSVVRFVFGLGLAMLALMALPRFRDTQNNKDALHSFLNSPWVLPLVLIVYLAVIVLDNLLIRWARKDSMGRARRALLAQKTPAPLPTPQEPPKEEFR